MKILNDLMGFVDTGKVEPESGQGGFGRSSAGEEGGSGGPLQGGFCVDGRALSRDKGDGPHAILIES